MRSFQSALAIMTGGLALTVVGCGPTATGPQMSGQTARPREQGTRLAAELGASLGAVTATGIIRGAMSAAPAPARMAALGSGPGVGCPAVSNPMDSDGDGIPDDVVLFFTLPACQFVAGEDTTEITGAVHVVDPVASPPPQPAAFGYEATFDHLRVHFVSVDPDSSATDTRTGSEALIVNSQGLNQGHAFAITHEDRQGIANIEDAWNAAFSPDPGVILIPGQPLPSGTFVVAGHSSWARGAESAAFTIGTAVPLRYDPACPANAPNRFRSGELGARLTTPGQQVLVRILFADCQDPTVVLVPVT